MKNTIIRFYKNPVGYLLFWTLVGLFVSYLSTLGGETSWEETKDAFYDFGVIGFYAGVIAAMAPHTRFKYMCHNWWLAALFWWISNWKWLQNDAGSAWFLATFFGLWLLYSKTESKGFYHSKDESP